MNIVSSFFLTAAITVIGASTSVAQAAIIQNGGFETGDFTGWTTSNLTYSGVANNSTGIFPHSGNYFAYLGTIGSIGFVSQNILTTVGQTYELSLFLKNQSQGAFPNQFQIFINGDNIFNQVNIDPPDYTKYSFNFIATAASTELKFGVQNDPAHLFLDDVNVIAISVPEPLSLGGIVVAGVIGLWMKRK
ncbi:carbohydrate binding domain-containing protein [Nostoc sp.]|uniref:carbohydrate binding domain-containing protein n=1 Tax=Nostoc sp. TaxID=1180 RepID=UPI002FFC8AAA